MIKRSTLSRFVLRDDGHTKHERNFSELDKMLKLNSLIFMAAAAVLMGGNSFAQDCNTCGTVSNYPVASGCSSCAAGGFGNSGRMSNHRAQLQQIFADNAKSRKRNDAWPMPFDCADRQLYFSIWNPMINQGFEEQCVLSSMHFDKETHELNKFGRHAVAGIMQNMPTQFKHVYVNRDSDQSVSDARMASVRDIVSTFYSQVAPNAQLDFSTKLPSSVTGTRAENINRQYIEGAPSPIIPISSGSDSVSASIGN
jgi:ribosomal protein L37E